MIFGRTCDPVFRDLLELGKLWFRTDLLRAQTQFESALTILPGYAPALEGLGKSAAAKGETKAAIDYFTEAFRALPIAQYAIDLGEVYTAAGDSTKALQQYALAEIAYERSTTSGVTTDLEYAMFLAEHDLKLPLALVKARAAYAERPSIYGADVLAWALYKNGRAAEALPYLKKSLSLGGHDASLLYHAALIQRELGEIIQALDYLGKCISLNRNFSIIHSHTVQNTFQNWQTIEED